MNTKDIYLILDKHRRLEFDKKINMANELNMTKQGLNSFFNILMKNNPTNQFNRVCEVLEKLGYELKIEKKSS